MSRRLNHGYIAAISYVDFLVGELLRALDRHGLSENTTIVLWGDNGFTVGEHNMWGAKHSNFEIATRVPLLIAPPGRYKEVRSSAMVESIDIFPTVAELSGLSAPEEIDGRSFARLFRRAGADHRREIHTVYPMTMDNGRVSLGRTLRTSRYRLVEWRPGAPDGYELYDLAVDPNENVSVSGHAAYARVLETMKRRLADWPGAQRPPIVDPAR